MAIGPIEFIAPTSRAMGRMTTILFRPFEIGKWCAIGFTAWLATLLEQCSQGGGNYSGGNFSEQEQKELKEEFQPAIDWANENMELLIGIGSAVLLLILILSVVITWVSSRGKLMFLDNVVHNRALVSEPWKEFRSEGNSLFRWNLLINILGSILVLGIVGVAGWLLYLNFPGEAPTTGWILGVVGAVLILILVTVVLAYFKTLLENFVVPTMYKHRVDGTVAWKSVLALHGTRPASFVLFFLWNFLIGIGVAAVLLLFMLLTCCIGGLLLAIPYVGAVLMLPLTVFLRALGPEFFRQFGPEYDLWENPIDPFGFEGGPPPIPQKF